MKLYVKKIWSLNPDLYKFIEFNKAQKEYNEWLKDSLNSSYYKKGDEIKSFEEWLKTEV